MLSEMSHPPATSMTCVRSVLALSRVMMIGGFGLFLDPAGRPLGRRDPFSPPSCSPPPEGEIRASSPPLPLPLPLFSSSSWPCLVPWPPNGEPPPWSSSDLRCSCCCWRW
uniref:Uncharacterized protein n=1 Tax=Triticum urartu TaxID=4572 RepID=A0A8R7UTG5_TRIUA